jgi:hypothetical protein
MILHKVGFVIIQYGFKKTKNHSEFPLDSVYKILLCI